MSRPKTVDLPKPLKPRGTPQQLKEKLLSQGYRKVGSGFFADAYAKDSHVIKIAAFDEGYENWLSYVLAYQNNPFMPKIHDVKRFENGYTVVSMEQLEHSYRKYQTYKPDSLAYGLRAPKNAHEKQIVACLKQVQKSRGWLDLHAGNVLFRGDQPVFTDPVA